MHHTWSAGVLAVAACSVNEYQLRVSSPVQTGHIPLFSHQDRWQWNHECTDARFCPSIGIGRVSASIALPSL